MAVNIPSNSSFQQPTLTYSSIVNSYSLTHIPHSPPSILTAQPFPLICDPAAAAAAAAFSQQQQAMNPTGEQTEHQAKKDAHHNRRAIHRRTQSQFDFKTCAGSSVASIPLFQQQKTLQQQQQQQVINQQTTPILQLDAFPSAKHGYGQTLAQHSPSSSMFSLTQFAEHRIPSLSNLMDTRQQQDDNIPNIIAGITSFQQQKVDQQCVSLLHSNSQNQLDSDGLFCENIEKVYFEQVCAERNAFEFKNSNEEEQEYEGKIRSTIDSDACVSSAGISMIEMIERMQERQQQDEQMAEKQQIIETIDADDYLRRSSPSNANNGFNFGKKKFKLYSSSFSHEINTQQVLPSSALASSPSSMTTTTLNSSIQQNQHQIVNAIGGNLLASQEDFVQKQPNRIGSPSGVNGSNGLGFLAASALAASFEEIEQNESNGGSSSPHSFASYHNQHHNHHHHPLLSSVLQPIPEQDMSTLGEFSSVSQPGSTRNNAQGGQDEKKKFIFHSHSNSLQNPSLTLSPQLFSPSIANSPSNHPQNSQQPVKRRVSSSKFSAEIGGPNGGGGMLNVLNFEENEYHRISSARDTYKSPSTQSSSVIVDLDSKSISSSAIPITPTIAFSNANSFNNNTLQQQQLQLSSSVLPTSSISHPTTLEHTQNQDDDNNNNVGAPIPTGISPSAQPFSYALTTASVSAATPQMTQAAITSSGQQISNEKKFFSSIKKAQSSQSNSLSTHIPQQTVEQSNTNNTNNNNSNNNNNQMNSNTNTTKHKKQSSLAEEMDLNLKAIHAHLSMLSRLDKPVSQSQTSIPPSQILTSSSASTLKVPPQSSKPQYVENPNTLLQPLPSNTHSHSHQKTQSSQLQQQQPQNQKQQQQQQQQQASQLHRLMKSLSKSQALIPAAGSQSGDTPCTSSQGGSAANSDRTPQTSWLMPTSQTASQQASQSQPSMKLFSNAYSTSFLESKHATQLHRTLPQSMQQQQQQQQQQSAAQQEIKIKPRKPTANMQQLQSNPKGSGMVSSNSNSSSTIANKSTAAATLSGVTRTTNAAAATTTSSSQSLSSSMYSQVIGASSTTSNPNLNSNHQRKVSAFSIPSAGSMTHAALATLTNHPAGQSNVTPSQSIPPHQFSQSAVLFSKNVAATGSQSTASTAQESSQQKKLPQKSSPNHVQQQSTHPIHSASASQLPTNTRGTKLQQVQQSQKQPHLQQGVATTTTAATLAQQSSSNSSLSVQSSSTATTTVAGTETESKKITELESIVSELRYRMHHLEETNSFLLNNIINLLDEKQSDKKHIQDIHSQTQQNNMNIAAIQQMITSKSSGHISAAKSINTSSHIHIDQIDNGASQQEQWMCGGIVSDANTPQQQQQHNQHQQHHHHHQSSQQFRLLNSVQKGRLHTDNFFHSAVFTPSSNNSSSNNTSHNQIEASLSSYSQPSPLSVEQPHLLQQQNSASTLHYHQQNTQRPQPGMQQSQQLKQNKQVSATQMFSSLKQDPNTVASAYMPITNVTAMPSMMNSNNSISNSHIQHNNTTSRGKQQNVDASQLEKQSQPAAATGTSQLLSKSKSQPSQLATSLQSSAIHRYQQQKQNQHSYMLQYQQQQHHNKG